ncbi:hypothetical protein C8F01DRAFT_1378129, partial [Mycena amicta]
MERYFTLVRWDAYFSTDPLVNKVVPYDKIPYQVMTDTGFQSDYNQCNATTENQDSLCQTIDDFCLWSLGTDEAKLHHFRHRRRRGGLLHQEGAWYTAHDHPCWRHHLQFHPVHPNPLLYPDRLHP